MKNNICSDYEEEKKKPVDAVDVQHRTVRTNTDKKRIASKIDIQLKSQLENKARGQ